ncbi:MAG TPA: extracellular solute-binding protein [Alphaproteobacteria bacterium]|nr:extracellular solute-binding protein [Alphaproteobacteria bacterium]
MQVRDMLLKTVSPLALVGVMAAAVATPLPAVAQNSNPPAAAALGEIKGDIRFSWWGGQSRNEKTDRILQLFEADYPGVKVEREAADWQPHWDKLTIQAAGGNQPCTIQMQTRWLATFAKPNILMPLDDLLAQGVFNVEGIAQPILDGARGNDGKLYMIPSGVFIFALMYNRTMADAVEAAGVTPLPNPYTWNQLADYARAAKPHLPEGVNAIHNMGRETDSFVTWVQTQGEKLFDGTTVTISKQTVVDWFNYWEALRKDGITDSAEVAVEDNGSLIEESNIATGRTFITNRPPNRLQSHQDVVDTVSPGSKLDIMPYPTAEDGTTGMDLGSNGIAIGATCPKELIPASVAWINFFTQDDRAAQIYQSDNGVVAVDRLADAQAKDPNTSPGQKRFIELFREVVDGAKPVAWPAGGYQAVTDTLGRAYDAVAFEQMSVEDAADQFLAELQEQVSNAAS